MTDTEIIKALECCSSRKNCEENCPYFELKRNFFECVQVSTSDAIDLIKRQQAEIEKARAEAIKEFADKLKEKAVDVGICDAQGNSFGGATVVFVGDIDNLVKEMVGADNE